MVLLRSRRFAIAACASLTIAAACTLFNPLDDYGPPKVTPNDASVDVPTSDEAGSSCTLTRWPARPDAGLDQDSGPDLELVFALESISLRPPSDGGAPIVASGYDLDGVCTCPGPPSCIPPAGGSRGCDQEGGIDSTATPLIEAFISLDLDVESYRRIQDGERGLLVRLRDYNGGPDDTRVEVAVFLTAGNDGVQADGGKPKIPIRDGTDRWTVDPDSLIGKTAPPYVPEYVDTNAYVSGGVIVATLDFPLSISDLVMYLKGSVTTARIVKRGEKYHLEDGRFVGRWPTKSLLTLLDSVRDPFVPGGGLCGDSSVYQDLKKQLCSGVDIVADTKQDSTQAPCDAISITAMFTAGPAQLGVVVPREPPKQRCGPGWADECQR